MDRSKFGRITMSIFAVTALSQALTSCSALDGLDVEPVKDVKVRNIDGSIRQPGQQQGFSIFGSDDDAATDKSFPFNLYLWQASIGTMGNIGIAQISPETGTIISDWFTSDGKTETKITIIVSGADFTSQNVIVRSARRIVGSSNKTETGSDLFNQRFKDAILANARDIRTNKLGPAVRSSWW